MKFCLSGDHPLPLQASSLLSIRQIVLAAQDPWLLVTVRQLPNDRTEIWREREMPAGSRV